MATTIPRLTDATTVGPSDELIVQQGGVTKRATASELAKGLNTINGTVNVKDFGAVGDGVANDTLAIYNALQAAENKTVLIPAGTYKCTFALIVPSGCTIFGYGATLDWSSATGTGTRIRIDGSLESAIAVSVAASKGDITLQVANGSGFVQNDLVRISSDASYGVTAQKKGELFIVRGVSGNTLRLFSPLNEDYLLADNPVVSKVNAQKDIGIYGISVVGRGSQSSGGNPISTGERGINAAYCRNVTVQDCSFYHTDSQGVGIVDGYGNTIKNNVITHDEVDGTPYVDGGGVLLPIQYGITLNNASCYNIVDGNIISSCRSGIVWSENGVGGSYFDIVSNNQIVGAWSNGISTHNATFNYLISNNVIRGCNSGINMRTAGGMIDGNIISDSKLHYSLSGSQTAIRLTQDCNNVTISNNRIDKQVFGITFTGLSAGNIPNDIVIANNTISDCSQKAIVVEQTENTSDAFGLVINGNTVSRVAGDYITVNGQFVAPQIRGNSLNDYDVATVGVGVRLRGTTKAQVTENSFGSLLPVALQESTHSSPQTPSFVVCVSNIFDHTTGFISGPVNDFIFKDNVKVTTSPSVTIASGAITVPTGAAYIVIDTEALAATDDLDTINGANTGDVIVFRAASGSRDVVFKDGTGNLRLSGDFTLDTTEDSMTLLWTGALWIEMSRSNNA